MSDVQTWSTTAGSNNSASPNGFPENMAPSGVNDSAREVMAAIAKYRADTDGVNSSTGSANAYVLAASRTITAYAQGDRFCFKANFTNTGAATLNVDAVGAQSIKRIDGTALQAGDILSGAVVDVVYDGTNFQLLSATQQSMPADNTLCPHSRLVIAYASAATLTISADTVVLEDSSGKQVKFSTLSETLTISSTGANGRDVSDNSGNEQASVWYHLFAIGKTDGTLDVFASQVGYPGSGTSIYTRLPSGYVYAGYIGAAYNDSSSDLRDFYQRGADVASWSAASVLNAGTAATFTAVSLATEVPVTARVVKIDGRSVATGAVTSVTGVMASDGSGTTLQYGFFVAGSGGASSAAMLGRTHGELLLTTAQQIKYYAVAGTSVTANVTGWRY